MKKCRWCQIPGQPWFCISSLAIETGINQKEESLNLNGWLVNKETISFIKNYLDFFSNTVYSTFFPTLTDFHYFKEQNERMARLRFRLGKEIQSYERVFFLSNDANQRSLKPLFLGLWFFLIFFTIFLYFRENRYFLLILIPGFM